MRRTLIVLLAIGGVAAFGATAVSVRAGDPKPTPTSSEGAKAFIRRLLATHAEDRVKADGELASADRDTLLAVARGLRDDFGPPLPRLATTTRGVELQARWLSVVPDDVCPMLGVDPSATSPTLSATPLEQVLSRIAQSTRVHQLTAPRLTVADGQRAISSVLSRPTGRAAFYTTGIVLGLHPAVSADGRSIRIELSVETRHDCPGASPAVLGALWRTELTLRDDGESLIVLPAAFSSEPAERRIALGIHAKVIDLGPAMVGTPFVDFVSSFDAEADGGQRR